MPLRLPALGLVTLAALSVLPAYAQPASSAPSEASAPVFRSAMDGYQPFSDEKLVPWRDANDNVGRIGGWRVYAREAQEGATGSKAAPPAPATGGPAARPASPATSPSNPHSGHGRP